MADAWRPERTAPERVGRALESMTPGTVQGRVAQARPVIDRLLNHSRPYDPDTEEAAGGGDTLFWQDEFTVGPGPQVVDLTWRPILNSEHVYWHPNSEDGLYLPGVEWARLKRRVTLADVESLFRGGDKVVVEYAYTPREQEAEPEPDYEWVIPVPGLITAYRQDIGAGPDVSYVGDRNGMWNDNNPGTYVQYATFEHPDVSYASYATGELQHKVVPPELPAGYGVFCRLTWSTLDSSMRRPVIRVRREGSSGDTTHCLYDPEGNTGPLIGPQGPVTTDIRLASGYYGQQGLIDFLNEIQPGNGRVFNLGIMSCWLSTIPWRTPSSRVHDAYLVVKQVS